MTRVSNYSTTTLILRTRRRKKRSPGSATTTTNSSPSGATTTTNSGRESNADAKVKVETSGNKSRYQQRHTAVVPRQPRFEGKCEGLKEHIIYDGSDANQSDTYTQTTKEIAEYAGSNYGYGGGIRITIENLTIVTLTQPTDLSADAGTAATCIWEEKLDEFMKRANYVEQNLQTIYSLVWGQCMEAMRQRIEGSDTYKEMKVEGKGFPLLMAIKDLVFNF
jgi:hypothetical protein